MTTDPSPRTPLARSWDLGAARPQPRRAGAVIDLAQLPLRPLVAALTRPRWYGVENLPATGPVILCGNHLGPLDALSYGHLLQASGIAPRFLGKESLFRIPLAGALLRSSGQIPVRRGARRGGDALEAARAALGRGEALMIFPEGTYTRDPELWPMRARLGAARLALATGAPLLPLASWGGRQLWPVGSPIPRPAPGRRVSVRIGTPLSAALREGETEHQAATRVTEEIMSRITELLVTLREETPQRVHDPRDDDHRPEAGQPRRRRDAA